MTAAEASKVMDRLTACYPSKRLDKATQATYLGKLGRLEYAPAVDAINEVTDSSTFFPSWAEIMAAYRKAEQERETRRLEIEAEAYQRALGSGEDAATGLWDAQDTTGGEGALTPPALVEAHAQRERMVIEGVWGAEAFRRRYVDVELTPQQRAEWELLRQRLAAHG